MTTTQADQRRPWRAAWLSRTYVVDGGSVGRMAPVDWASDGLGALLTRMAPRYGREGVLMLDGSAAELLTLPTDFDAVRERHKVRPLADHPAVADAARAGWTCRGIGDFSTFVREDQALTVGVAPLLNLRQDKDGRHVEFPLWDKWAPNVVAALDLWHTVTGCAWYGNPGLAGTQILKATTPRESKNGVHPPTWKPKYATESDYPTGAHEQDYLITDWRFEQPGEWLHGYDANRAYIAALIALEVAPWGLKHTGRIPFDKRRGGWWHVELPHQNNVPTWNLPHMPHPAGYLPDIGNPAERYVTTQTLTLLETLTAQGIFGGVRIIDSWTGPIRDFPMRAFGERLRDAYALRDAVTWEPVSTVRYDELDRQRVQLAVKLAGRAAPGLWASASNWINRPDWWASLVGLDRANRWRLMWKEGQATNRWPTAIDHDQVYWPSDERDATRAAPSVLRGKDSHGRPRLDPSGMTLGAYKPKRTLPNPGADRSPRARARKAAADAKQPR